MEPISSGLLLDFAAVLAAATQFGNDLVITVGGSDSITLLDVSKNELHADDFLFV